MARDASKRFTQQVPLTFFKVSGQNEVTINGMATRHHLGIDPDTRTLVNSRNTQCTIHENLLKEAGFTTRNANNDVILKGVYVRYADHTGVSKVYVIAETYPDDTLGIIVCTLNQFRE